MTYVTCRLTAKYRDQLRNPTLGNRVCATFLPFTSNGEGRGRDGRVGEGRGGDVVPPLLGESYAAGTDVTPCP